MAGVVKLISNLARGRLPSAAVVEQAAAGPPSGRASASARLAQRGLCLASPSTPPDPVHRGLFGWLFEGCDTINATMGTEKRAGWSFLSSPDSTSLAQRVPADSDTYMQTRARIRTSADKRQLQRECGESSA